MDTRQSGPPRVDEDELHALVDGRLTAAQTADLRHRLESDPQAQATASAWMAQRDALKRTFAAPAIDTLPAPLLAAANRAQALRSSAEQWTRWAGMAASVVMAFGLGWVASIEYTARFNAPSPVQQFMRQAAFAHVVYQPEVRHPVEVTAQQQDHLVQWLSKRLGHPLKVPDLRSKGFELLGGRLLPGENGARAQFMYQNGAGQRLTLYLGAVKDGEKAKVDTRETAFRFFDDGPVPGFYWVDQGFGCAITAPLPRGELLEIAKAAYQQVDW
ncbi:anti-sigma factor family protein [Ramlibacter sp. PS4R-6]|uniref:anti-sigma factor family protein n=1 Tax=Ramlibacter sp. PS4R-6 TaxID=3133438 RepID=UPI0030B21362